MNFIKKLFHKCQYEKRGYMFFGGYMNDGTVYLQNYKCKYCSKTKTERV
jgi:hypothetical protein